ncbi:CopG family transcriptional regulator [Thermus scotoductus]|jgi:predicted DNA-binding protein|uniref:CopG family transcriptional regulator n=2 Tax=Thermus TaxID=270 RepID=A0A430SB16_THESC|nr:MULTISPECIES: ribbon-helix-helix domain-containing protein [Thermus]MBW6394447.1 ribbon-helix-helix domain-containing protein [Thermus brevis]RTG95614.1 CopG family transcriptional regulator [Thermus scotoductus]RTH09725.1 CopG family transcriptional regulator [Thermus scotoductus]RTH10422.1 CopG family transcriptional regulator [Thermus scotoductus]RTH12798.1 CopG family transcriptional regulator [Thermus scotoductus]
MVRTQVQLTEEQAQRLKALAQEEGVSLAELVRRAVEGYLQEKGNGSFPERAERALAVVGRFASGLTDVSQEHDRYLAMDEDRLGHLR